MQTFTSGGIPFVMLDEGELTPPFTPYLMDARLIYHYEGRWWIKILRKGKWVDYTDKNFPTQNEAFNYAYETSLKRN